MRVAFAGTPEFARIALERILAAGFEVPLVLTQPDRPAGRGLRASASAVKEEALRHALALAQPAGLRLDGRHAADARAAQAALQSARPDVLVVAAYGLLLPPWVLGLPTHGCLNIHASLLPRWRGAAPIHRAIEAGDVDTGITLMQMDEGLDTGDTLLVEREAIAADDTTAALHDRLAALGGRLVVEALIALGRGGLVRTPQPADGASYARKIDKAEARIDWSRPAAEIERRVRAFDPFPGSIFEFAGEAVKLWGAEVRERESSPAPGTVLQAEAECVVACGEGALALTRLQRPGGRRIAAREFLGGRPSLVPGTRL